MEADGEASGGSGGPETIPCRIAEIHREDVDDGTAVTEREVHGGHLFHTYFRALGLDPTKKFYVEQRPIPMADPKASAIGEVLRHA